MVKGRLGRFEIRSQTKVFLTIGNKICRYKISMRAGTVPQMWVEEKGVGNMKHNLRQLSTLELIRMIETEELKKNSNFPRTLNNSNL